MVAIEISLSGNSPAPTAYLGDSPAGGGGLSPSLATSPRRTSGRDAAERGPGMAGKLKRHDGAGVSREPRIGPS